jgi:large subunit ribosomal protein L17
MRHRSAFRKLSRTSAHRQALFKNLATSLFDKGQVKTTLAKAKELRRVAEKLITSARGGDLAARRRAYGYITSKPVVHKLFTDIAPRYVSRPGGYTRIVKLGMRQSDAAEMAVISLVESEEGAGKAKKKTSRGAKKANAAGKDSVSSGQVDAPEGGATSKRSAKKAAVEAAE